MFVPAVLGRVGTSAVPVRVITHDLETMRNLLQDNAMIHDARNNIEIKLHTDRIHARAQRQDTCEGIETGYMRGHGHSNWHREHVGYRLWGRR